MDDDGVGVGVGGGGGGEGGVNGGRRELYILHVASETEREIPYGGSIVEH